MSTGTYRKTLIIYGASVLALACVAVVITVLVSKSPGSGSDPSAYHVADELTDSAFLDIVIPDELVPGTQPDWYPLREPVYRWTKEMAAPYWIPLEDIIRDHVKKENERKIRDLFNNIP